MMRPRKVPPTAAGTTVLHSDITASTTSSTAQHTHFKCHPIVHLKLKSSLMLCKSQVYDIRY